MAPSWQRGIHKKRGDCHPSMHAAPTPQESSSSWLALMDNQTSPIALSNYQNKLCLIDLGKLMATAFVSRRPIQAN